jgi:CubicO group peptidase (beta-lactamase class C family)
MASSFFQELDALISVQAEDLQDASSVLTALGVPAASIAILTTTGIITNTIANSSSPTDPETLFQACSISKPICGLGVLRTIDQGKLALTDPVTKHLPADYIQAISTPSTRPLLDHVTIQHLITHTAGTTVHGFPGYDPSSPIPSLPDILSGGPNSNTPQIRLNRFPGLKWRYSGGGTTITQAILESIHRRPLPDILRELVFQPLDMTRSFYSLPHGETNHAQCWDTGVTESRPARWHIQPELGAAGLWTTPTDLLKALSAIRDSAEGKSAFLRTETALTGLRVVQGANGWTGAGWQSGKGWIGHGGSNSPGFRCELMATWADSDGDEPLGKARGEGIAIMTNSGMGTELCHRLIQAIAYLRGWPGRDIVALHEGGKMAIPVADPRAGLDDAWKVWEGTWSISVQNEDDTTSKAQALDITEGTENEPRVTLGQMPAMKLLRAAAPRKRYGKETKEGLDLVVEGLDMMLCLGYDEEGKPALEVWPGCYEDMLKCKRGT